jgi:hypothetical protein
MGVVFGVAVASWLFETTTKHEVRETVFVAGDGTILFEKEDEEVGDTAAFHDYFDVGSIVEIDEVGSRKKRPLSLLCCSGAWCDGVLANLPR